MIKVAVCFHQHFYVILFFISSARVGVDLQVGADGNQLQWLHWHMLKEKYFHVSFIQKTFL